MRDDFDSVVADRFKVLDQVPVPDTWSRIRNTEEVLTMLDVESAVLTLDLETAVLTEPRPKRPMRVLVAGIMAAAAVAAMVFVATRDAENPADEPSPTVTVPPTVPPRALPNTRGFALLAPGTYFVNEVSGIPTPRIFATIGDGWWHGGDDWYIEKREAYPDHEVPEDPLVGYIGAMSFSHPIMVFSDACHWEDGHYPGSVATLDGLVAALTEQQGWAEVTAPSDISIDGYAGKAFQRTAPAVISDCDLQVTNSQEDVRSWNPMLTSWETDSHSRSGYRAGSIETLWVLDIDGTVVIISAGVTPGPSAGASPDFAADVLDSIRIDPPPRALFGSPDEQFVPGTYFVNEVDGSPTPRILVTIRAGWTNTAEGWGIGQDDVGFITFSRPDSVFLDACHWSDGYHPGPVTTLDGLVAALSEQGGWVDVTAPSDISVDGYVGQAFQRTAPSEFTGCAGPHPFRGWENEDEDGNKGWSYYEPGEIETLWILDLDGTIIIINTRIGSDQPAAAHAEFAAVLDSISIDRE